MKLKLYRSFFAILGLMLIVITISFLQYKESYFATRFYKNYDEMKAKCKDSYEYDICKKYAISDKESYEREVKNNIYERRKELDIRELGFTTLEFYLFYYVSIFMPLITAILVCPMVLRDTNTGFYEHVLSRKDYKKYILDKIKSISIYALIQPLSILTIFIISGILTKFNFSLKNFTPGLAIYSLFKKNHFFFSIFLMMLLSFLTNFIFGIISAMVSIKEKSSVVAIIKSYLLCVVLVLSDYFISVMLIHSIIPSSIIAEESLPPSFDVLTYYILDKNMSFPLAFSNILLLLVISCLVFIKKYRRKENFYAAIERENTSI